MWLQGNLKKESVNVSDLTSDALLSVHVLGTAADKTDNLAYIILCFLLFGLLLDMKTWL